MFMGKHWRFSKCKFAWYPPQVGFSYGILLESTITGYLLHSRGWKSAYLYPKTPCFLGCAPTDIKEGMLQLVKWLSELLLLGVSSKYSPFTYGFSRMSILHTFTYCFITMSSLYAVVFILYGIVPQVCLLKGIPVFPKVNFQFKYLTTLQLIYFWVILIYFLNYWEIFNLVPIKKFYNWVPRVNLYQLETARKWQFIVILKILGTQM